MVGAAPRPWLLVVVAALMISRLAGRAGTGGALLQGTAPPSVQSAAGPSVANAAVIAALGLDASLVQSVSFGNSDPDGYGVLTPTAGTTQAGMPTQGTSYLALTNGRVDSVPLPTVDNASWSQPIQLPKTNGDHEDLVQMTLVLKPPSWAKSWSVQWKFLSEEYDEYVGGTLSDHLLEAGATNFTVEPINKKIIAPNNIAFDPSGQLIGVDLTGACRAVQHA